MVLDQPSLFDPEFRQGRHRIPDKATSVAGAVSVAYRAGSQKQRLLDAFKAAYPASLTDDEACVAAGLPLTSCYWKRCSELRQDRAIIVGPERVSRHTGERRITNTYNKDQGE